MRRAAIVLALSVAGAARAGDEADGASGGERAFVEIATPRAAYFVGEPIRLAVRIGFDEEYFRTNAVPLFVRPMDVPVQVEAPWLAGLPGTIALPPGPPGGGATLTFALGDDVTRGSRTDDRVKGGRRFAVVEIERRFLSQREGELVIPAPRLRFAHAARFAEDALGGRVAADRRDAFVDGSPLTLRIAALPGEGRPAGFTGAVGRFAVRAEAAPRNVEAGASLKLTLSISGEGNLTSFDPPRLDGLAGFHVLGALDDRGSPRRTVTYDIAPLRAGVTSVPAIEFPYFDPGPPPAYRAVRTEPIPIAVGPARGGTPAEPPSADAASPSGATPGAEPPLGTVAKTVAQALVAASLAVIGILFSRRRRARTPADPGRDRAGAAAAAFRARAAAADADLAGAFAEFLAARLGCPAAAVIGSDLASRLASAGVPADLATRAAARLERLVGTRYGGSAEAGGAAAARALVDELEASFRASEAAR